MLDIVVIYDPSEIEPLCDVGTLLAAHSPPTRDPIVVARTNGSRLPVPLAWPHPPEEWAMVVTLRRAIETLLQEGVAEHAWVLESTCGSSLGSSVTPNDLDSDFDAWVIREGTWPERPPDVRLGGPGAAYVLTKDGLRGLYTCLCDIQRGFWQSMRRFQESHRVACLQKPDVRSDRIGMSVEIKGNPSHGRVVVFLRASKKTMDVLRSLGWHSGHWRDAGSGVDLGLDRILRDESDPAAFRQLVERLTREAASVPGFLPVLWHPLLDHAWVRANMERELIVIDAVDADDAVRQYRYGLLAQARRSFLQIQQAMGSCHAI